MSTSNARDETRAQRASSCCEMFARDEACRCEVSTRRGRRHVVTSTTSRSDRDPIRSTPNFWTTSSNFSGPFFFFDPIRIDRARRARQKFCKTFHFFFKKFQKKTSKNFKKNCNFFCIRIEPTPELCQDLTQCQSRNPRIRGFPVLGVWGVRTPPKPLQIMNAIK